LKLQVPNEVRTNGRASSLVLSSGSLVVGSG